MLFVFSLTDFTQKRGENFPIALMVDIFGMVDTVSGEVGDFWITENMLVRDFLSLLHLFVWLRSADVEPLEQKDKRNRQRR